MVDGFMNAWEQIVDFLAENPDDRCQQFFVPLHHPHRHGAIVRQGTAMAGSFSRRLFRGVRGDLSVKLTAADRLGKVVVYAGGMHFSRSASM